MVETIILVITAIAIIAITLYLYLNRNPIRTIPPENNVVSPANGKIIEILDLLDLKQKKSKIKNPKELIKKIKKTAHEISKHCYVIVILMNIHNVNVQRTPVEGKVISVKHTKGKVLHPNSLEATIKNEKIETTIKNKDIGKIKVIQVAGLFTRKIINHIKKNEMLLKGEKIGRIKFRGQVVLIMPDLHLKVKKGDDVIAGETVIAVYE